MCFRNKIILASSSSRRKEILENLNFQIEKIDIDFDESIDSKIENRFVSKEICIKKAKQIVYKNIQNKYPILVADTVVFDNKTIYLKPKNESEAFYILKKLSNNYHFVSTSFALIINNTYNVFTEYTKVFFDKISDKIINKYIEVYKPFDKSGSYGIQEYIGMIGIKRIEGCLYNVIGLPTNRFITEYNKINKFLY